MIFSDCEQAQDERAIADHGVFVEKGGESHQGDVTAVPRGAEARASPRAAKGASGGKVPGGAAARDPGQPLGFPTASPVAVLMRCCVMDSVLEATRPWPPHPGLGTAPALLRGAGARAGSSFPGAEPPDWNLSAAFEARIYRQGKAFYQP